MQSPDIEQWRPVPIPEYADTYEVSNHGRVRRPKPPVGKGSCGRKVGYLLKPKPIKSGHLVVDLFHLGSARRFLIHRLVLAAFVGPQPEGMEGCHGDGNPANNHLANLRWDTRRNNIKDTRRHGRLNHGSRNGKAILTEDHVRQIRLLQKGGAKGADIARAFNTSPQTVSFIKSRRTWRHI